MNDFVVFYSNRPNNCNKIKIYGHKDSRRVKQEKQKKNNNEKKEKLFMFLRCFETPNVTEKSIP